MGRPEDLFSPTRAPLDPDHPSAMCSGWININLSWGAVLLVFGIVMLLLGRCESETAKPALTSLEGRRMMEERDDGSSTEHRSAE